jgi:hypothetical protein
MRQVPAILDRQEMPSSRDQQVACCLFKCMCIVCPEIGTNEAPDAAAAAAGAEKAASTDREKSFLSNTHTMLIRTMKS